MYTCIDVDKLVHTCMYIHRHMLEIMEGGGYKQPLLVGTYLYISIIDYYRCNNLEHDIRSNICSLSNF